ncbi:hypothetical protein NIA69_12230 [Gemmiger formicilis]|nr:hypothetical protein [Gemmiger formicilis]
MAEMTLCGSMANKWRLSLGGISASERSRQHCRNFAPAPGNHHDRAAARQRQSGRMASVGIQKIYADHYQMLDLPPCIENGITLIWQKQPDGKDGRPPRRPADRRHEMKIHSFAHLGP